MENEKTGFVVSCVIGTYTFRISFALLNTDLPGKLLRSPTVCLSRFMSHSFIHSFIHYLRAISTCIRCKHLIHSLFSDENESVNDSGALKSHSVSMFPYVF